MAYSSKNPRYDSTILTDIAAATPANPASGSHKIVDRNGALYLRDSAGNETAIGAGSSSGINYNTNPSAQAGVGGYVASGGGVTVARDTTAADLPRESLTASAVLITCVSGTTDYIRYRFQLGDADKSKQLFASWAQKPLSGYAAGDLVFEMWTNTASNYGGTYAQLSIGTPNIPSSDFVFSSVWSSDSSDYYEARWRIASGTGALAMCDISFSPQVPVSIPSAEVEYAFNTGTWNADDSTSFGYGAGGGSIAGTLTANHFKRVQFKSPILLTDEIVLQTSQSGILWTTMGSSLLGGNQTVSFRDTRISAGSPSESGFELDIVDSTHVDVTFLQYQYQYETLPAGTITPINWSTGLWRVVKRTSQEVFVSNNQVEYVSNSDTSDADNLTAFAYGIGGSRFSNITAPRSKKVQFRTPIQPTDKLEFQYTLDGGITWGDIQDSFGGAIGAFQLQNANTYGLVFSAIDNYSITVDFQTYKIASGATYGSAGASWAGIAGNTSAFWRVIKSSNPLGIGMNLVSQSNSGLIASAGQLLGTNTNDTANAGYVGEIIESFIPSGSAVSVINNTPVNITSVNIGPGDWLATAVVTLKGTLTGTGWLMSANDSNAVIGTIGDRTVQTPTLPTATYDCSQVISKEFTVAGGGSANIYAVVQANFTAGSASGYGRLTLRRMR